MEGLPQKVVSGLARQHAYERSLPSVSAPARTVTLDRRLEELPFPCQDSAILECALGTKEAVCTSEAARPGERNMASGCWGGFVGDKKLTP